MSSCKPTCLAWPIITSPSTYTLKWDAATAQWGEAGRLRSSYGRVTKGILAFPSPKFDKVRGGSCSHRTFQKMKLRERVVPYLGYGERMRGPGFKVWWRLHGNRHFVSCLLSFQQPSLFPYIHLTFLGGSRAQDHETGAHRALRETVCVLTGQLWDRDEPHHLISVMGWCYFQFGLASACTLAFPGSLDTGLL